MRRLIALWMFLIVIFLTMTACIQVRIVTTRAVEFDLPWSTSEPIWTSVPTIENTPSPTITQIVQTPDNITPTLQSGTLDPSPTWSACFLENYFVYTTGNNLAIRQTTISASVNPLNQPILRRVNPGTRLEVETCLFDTTPNLWLPVLTDDGLQGIVSGAWVDVRPPG